MKLAKTCHRCPLAEKRQNLVWGEGPESSPIIFVAEGPGKHEDRLGRPFVDYAKAGRELTHLLKRLGLPRERVYLTNMVKCRCPNDRDPTESEISTCSYWLEEEIKRINPRIIVAVGRISSRYFLGDVDMETCHGIPYQIDDRIIIPVYHPAAGLHSPQRLMHVYADFEAVVDTLHGKLKPKPLGNGDPGPVDYQEGTLLLEDEPLVAIDTEWARGKPWCLTASNCPGKACMLMTDNIGEIDALNKYVNYPGVTTILHNSLYDLPVLHQMGVHPARVVDTMIMAYLLQSEPQGLKPLAYRHAGMKMGSYNEVVAPATFKHAMLYLANALHHSFPDPEHILHWVKGVPKVKKPWNIIKKVASILNDQHTKGVNPWDRWHNIKPDEGRGQVEAILGPMQRGELCDIDFETAKVYACQDASATMAIYPYLRDRIARYGLTRALEIDMRALPMIVDMMAAGIKPNLEKFAGLSDYFQTRMDKLDTEITKSTGKTINPGSDDMIRQLLFKDLGLKSIKKTPKGKEGTGDKILAQLKTKHPVVQVIRDWRAYQKLKSTYSDPMPGHVGDDGRIHSTARVTRTATGRLSMAKPNLMAIPVRSDDGRKIRDCYEAEEGNVILSCDFSQIELRIMAHEANEKSMIEAFRQGIDIHTQTASDVFGIPLSRVHDYDHRRPSKTINFGIPYGMTAQGLMDSMLKDGADPDKWTLSACQDFINAWFDARPGIRTFMSETHAYARRKGYVKDIWGRVRFTPGVYASDRRIVEESLREAGNHPIQGGAAGVIKQAMGDLTPVYKQFMSEGIIIKPLIQIHDDLVWEIQESKAKILVPVVMSFMEDAVELKVPTPVDPKTGFTWGKLCDWGAK